MEFPTARTRMEDVRERAHALSAAGAVVTVVLASAPASLEAEAQAQGLPAGWSLAHGDWTRAARAALSARPGATLVLAGECAPREVARAATLGAGEVRLWPTVLRGESAHDRRALDCAVGARSRGVSGRSSLWDGDYVLVPGSPGSDAARPAIEAFARLAADHASLDLVFLGERHERAAQCARAHGVRGRVHWAGASPLRAECGWLAGAGVVLLTEHEAAEPPLVLRALAAGSPIAVAGSGPRANHLREWLRDHGAATPLAEAGARDLACCLRGLLSGGSEVRAACARGAALAGKHEWKALAPALRDRISRNGLRAAA